MAQKSGTINSLHVTLVYEGDEEFSDEQPLDDLPIVGTLVDPETTEELNLIGCRLHGSEILHPSGKVTLHYATGETQPLSDVDSCGTLEDEDGRALKLTGVSIDGVNEAGVALSTLPRDKATGESIQNCIECGVFLRPQGTGRHEYPNTYAHAAKGKCVNCYYRGKDGRYSQKG